MLSRYTQLTSAGKCSQCRAASRRPPLRGEQMQSAELVSVGERQCQPETQVRTGGRKNCRAGERGEVCGSNLKKRSGERRLGSRSGARQQWRVIRNARTKAARHARSNVLLCSLCCLPADPCRETRAQTALLCWAIVIRNSHPGLAMSLKTAGQLEQRAVRLLLGSLCYVALLAPPSGVP